MVPRRGSRQRKAAIDVTYVPPPPQSRRSRRLNHCDAVAAETCDPNSQTGHSRRQSSRMMKREVEEPVFTAECTGRNSAPVIQQVPHSEHDHLNSDPTEDVVNCQTGRSQRQSSRMMKRVAELPVFTAECTGRNSAPVIQQVPHSEHDHLNSDPTEDVVNCQTGRSQRQSSRMMKRVAEEPVFTAECPGRNSAPVIQQVPHVEHVHLNSEPTADVVKYQRRVLQLHPSAAAGGVAAGSISATADHNTTLLPDNDVALGNLSNKEKGASSNNCTRQMATSFNLTEIAQQMFDDDLDEVDSYLSKNGLVLVNGYEIKPQYETLLRDIVAKYGDIAANCALTTVKCRSFLMSTVCEMVDKLRNTNFIELSDADFEQMTGFLADAETQNIDVGWIRGRMNEIREGKEAIKVLRQNNRTELKAEIKERSRELKDYKQQKAVKEAELRGLDEKIYAAEQDIVAMEKVISENREKLRQIVGLNLLAHGLI